MAKHYIEFIYIEAIKAKWIIGLCDEMTSQYNLMAALSINEDSSREGIIELSRNKSEWDDPNYDRNIFDLFED